MPPYINIVRSDGSVISATPEEAKNLALLGYREESASEAASREAQKAVEAHYTTLGQKADAALEAGLRGATLGLTDYIAGDEDSANRRRYNPGLSTAFEIGGALVPLVLSGGESAAAESSVLARVAGLAPTTIVSRGARAVAGVTEETGALRSVMAGALEGGAYGGAQEVNRAYLDGDPVTAESVLHGIGWGAVYGGALTGVGEGLMGAGRKLAARGEEVTAGRLGQEAENAWRSEAAAADHKVDLFRAGLDQDAVRAKNALGENAANLRREAWEREIEAVMADNAQVEATNARFAEMNQIGRDIYQSELGRVARGNETLGKFNAAETADWEAQAASVRAENDAAKSAYEEAKRAWQEERSGVAETNAKLKADYDAAYARYQKSAQEVRALNKSPAPNPIAPTRDAYAMFRQEVTSASLGLEGVEASANKAIKGVLSELNSIPEDELGALGQARAAKGALKRVVRMMENDSIDPRRMRYAIEDLGEKLDNFNQFVGRHYKPVEALTELARVKAVSKALAKMPTTADEFVAMTSKDADRLFAALDGAKQLKAYPASVKAVEDAANAFASSAGLAQAGTADLHKTWKALRDMLKAEREPIPMPAKPEAPNYARTGPRPQAPAAKNLPPKPRALDMLESPEKPYERRMLPTEKLPAEPEGFTPRREPKAPQGYREPRPKTVKEEAPQSGAPIGDAGFWAVKALTGSTHKAAAWAAAKTVMAKLRGQTLDRIEQAAAKYLPKAGKAVKFAAPRIDPLKVKLDGNYEAANKPRDQLAADRVREFMAAYPTINDRMFKAVEPLMQHEPALAPAMHKAGVDAFNAILGELPKDPGSVSGLRPIWKPSVIEAETLSRKLAVFHDPVGEAEQMLSSGDFDPIKVKTMKVVAPNVWNNLRISMLTRMEDPAFVDRMSYQDQIGLGTMLDLNLHSSMRPEQIATHQQLFLQRNQPLPTPQPAGSSSSSGGRPAATSPGATQGQKVTDR